MGEGNKGEAGLNHLAGQKSPYLLQHARNPVDWYPWNDEALAKAKTEDKLLIISVGYAACHWCHVMEHESFEDSTVAAVMNAHFVSIKVDREERPDIDDVYMTACQLTKQNGCGWPLNAIALPDGRPIYALTYAPKQQWTKLLEQFIKLKAKDPAKLEEYAAALTAELGKRNTFQPVTGEAGDLSAGEIDGIADELLTSIDYAGGGTAGAPKFPMPALHEFLLARHFYTKDDRALEAVTVTLDRMADGGIYDHLAGGFARYSTDAAWKVPHFEKMLYDNSQLVSLYAHAYQVTGRARYAEVVRQTLGFVEASLSDPGGVFYASLDADTEGEEGKTYVWTKAEIDGLLNDPKRSAAFADYYSVEEGGNWEGRNILFRKTDANRIAQKHGYTDAVALKADMDAAAATLLAARNERPQPLLDDKGLTGLSGLMISGYVNAFRALGDGAYRARAIKAGQFLRDKMMQTDGRLDRNFKGGTSAINGFLDDYGMMAQACVDLYQVTFDAGWLKTAETLVAYTNAHFYDQEIEMYNYTSDLDPPLISGNVPVNDKAIPSGNSVMARVLYQLGTLLADEEMTGRARKMLTRVRPLLKADGARFYANWARLYVEVMEPTYEIAVLGADAGEMREEMTKYFHPNALFLGGKVEGDLQLLTNKMVPGETTIYVCLEKVCQLPVNEPKQALAQLR